MFFTNEIKASKTIHTDLTTNKTEIVENYIRLETPMIINEFAKKIYDQDASKIVDSSGNQVAISKAIFAENVIKGIDDFAKVKFTEFKEIFKIIENIIIGLVI